MKEGRFRTMRIRIISRNDAEELLKTDEFPVNTAVIDGIRVKRVEHVPNVRSAILRFEEGIEEISLQGFHGEIYRLLLPDSLVRIHEGSFQNLSSLREITMNGAVLESSVFAHCVNLERVHFGPKLWSIMDRAFEGCLRLKQVEFPDKIFSIGEEAFLGCSMEMLVLPGMECLKDGAFRNCASLEVVRFTGDIGNPRGDPFAECDSLKRFVDVEKTKGLTFTNRELIYTIEDAISPTFSRSGKEATGVHRRLIHKISNS